MEEILEDVECSVCGGQLRKKRVNVPTIQPNGFPIMGYYGVCIKCNKWHSVLGIPTKS